MTDTKKVITHTIDADGKILGRLATEIATLLRGKNKVGFTFYQDHGDRVVIKNAKKIVLTGNKATQKKYYRHSGYPGGLREVSYAEMNQTHPDRVIRLAVKNMLPNNRLRTGWLKRLIIETEESNA